MDEEISIVFCPVWGYRKQASSLAAVIKQNLEKDVVFKNGEPGQFDVYRGNQLLYSRYQTGDFPTEDLIIHLINQ